MLSYEERDFIPSLFCFCITFNIAFKENIVLVLIEIKIKPLPKEGLPYDLQN